MPTLGLAIDARQAKDGALQFSISADQIKKVAGEAVKATQGLEQSTKAYGQTAASVKGMVAGLVQAYIGFEAVKSTFRGLATEQAAMAQINAGLKSTGGISGQTAESIRDLSKEMMRLTTFSDEAVLSAQSILLTFGHISGDIFPATVEAAANVAARFGRELPDTMLALGKAIDSPSEGMMNLVRIGIRFTESQQAIIKMMDSTGNHAEAQRYMLKILEQQFGGSAAAARDTLGGALTGLKNDYEELAKSIAESASPKLREWMQTASDAARVMTGHKEHVQGNVKEAERLAFTIEAVIAGLVAYKGAQVAVKAGELAGELVTLSGAFDAVKLAALGAKGVIGAGILLDAGLIAEDVNLIIQLHDALDNAANVEVRMAEVSAAAAKRRKEQSLATQQLASEQERLNQALESANDTDLTEWFKSPKGTFSFVKGLDEVATKFSEIDAEIKTAGDDLEKINAVAAKFGDFWRMHENAIKAVPGGDQMAVGIMLKISPLQQAAFKKADESIQKHFEDLDLEIKYQGLPQEELEKAKKLLEFTREVNKVYGANSSESLTRITEYEQKLNTLIATSPELAHKRAEAAAQMYEQMEDYGEGYYQAQKKLLEMQKQEYAVYVNDKVLLEKWYQNQIQKLQEEQHPLTKYRNELKRDLYDNSGRYVEEKFVEAAGRVESAWSDAFYSMIQDGGSFKDAMNGLLESVGQSFARMASDMMARMVMMQTMNAIGSAAGFDWTGAILNSAASAGMGAFSGGFGGGTTSTGSSTNVGATGSTNPYSGFTYKLAMGGVMNRGDVVPFAGGGVFDRPTNFPMTGGKTGLMGENGPEAIMPLTRDSSGRLGVKSQGQQTVNQNNLKIVNVLDTSVVGDYMSSSNGERVIINAIKRNRGIVKGLM